MLWSCKTGNIHINTGKSIKMYEIPCLREACYSSLSTRAMTQSQTLSINFPKSWHHAMTLGLYIYIFLKLLTNAYLIIVLTCWYLILLINPNNRQSLFSKQCRSLFLSSSASIHLVSMAYKWEEVEIWIIYLYIHKHVMWLLQLWIHWLLYDWQSTIYHKHMPYKEF